MKTGKDLFIEQLEQLGFPVEDHGRDLVSFPFAVPSGRLKGEVIQLGFQIPSDFNLTPPHGPHISPRLFPNKGGGNHPDGGIHDSPFGPEWHHWSRPLNHWAQTDRSVRVIMAHIRRLFDIL